jgi:serine/threonine-protein kinase
MTFCLDDGAELLYGPAAADEPRTAILPEAGPTSESPTRTLDSEETGTKILHDDEDGESGPKTASKKATVIAGIVGVLVITALGIGGYFYYGGGGTNQIESIAVMPFQNSSDSSDSEYLTDGLAESLIYSLSQIEGLKVSPTSSVFRYKGKQTDSVIAGKELGVEAVMTGRIAQRGDDLKISVELVDVRNNKTLWGEQYNRKMSELLATQQEIAAEIVQKLKLKLAGGSEKKLRKTYTADNEAYQLYLKGRFHHAKRTKADLEKGVTYFEQAIARDPGFALAWVGIADAYRTMPSYGYVSPKEVGPKAIAAAQKAIEIDPDLAEAHAAVAGVALFFEWNWQKGESEFKKAIELGPNVADVHRAYGFSYLAPMGRFTEAIAELKRALELEPLSVVYGSQLAATYIYDGQKDKALEQVAAATYLAPGHPTVAYHSGVVYNTAGLYDKAIELAEGSLEKDPTNQDGLVNAGYAYAKSGQRRKAEEIIARLQEISKSQYVLTSYFAQIYGALGEKDKAITELEKAFENRDVDITKLNIHPYFDDIRDDPRFSAIAKRAGLPDRK